MNKLVSLKLQSGENVYVEVTDSDEEAWRAVNASPSKPLPAGGFEQALESLRPAASALFDAFKEFNSPSSIELEMGVKFSAKLKTFFFASDGEAAFRLKLTWDRREPTG